MKKNLIKITILAAACALLFACGKPDKKSDAFDGVPPGVAAAIQAQAKRNFPSNENLARVWTNNQIASYRAYSNYLPQMPVDVFNKFSKYAQDIAPAQDYAALMDNLESLVYAYEKLNGRLAKLPADDAAFVKSLFNDSNAVEYKACADRADAWVAALEDIRYMQKRFPPEDFAALRKLYLEKYRNSPDVALSEFYRQSRAMDKLNAFSRRDVGKDDMAKIKAEIAETHKHDFAAQFDALEKYDFSKIKKAAAENNAESARKKSLRVVAEQIFRDCVFTQRGEGDSISVAVLVKMNGKSVVICSKDFIPQRMPATFGNSRGTIVCSKAFICDDYPVIIMIPDSEPSMFNPIEAITAEEAKTIHEKPLYLIAPDRGGFTGKPIKIFSEDLKFFNFTVDDTPKTSREMKLYALDRDANKVVINIIDQMEVGEHAVVFEPETRKLVSVSLRYYALGQIDLGGRTGNVIGFEKMPIPDFVSFVRQFDGNVGKTMYPPTSSVRFIRISNLKNWSRFDVPTFWKQKNIVRKYTDVNNEYLKFFRAPSYFNAIRSVRISNIAKRYKKDFEERNLSRDSFLRRYEEFVVDILQSMRVDANRFGNSSFTPNSIYSIYRGEFEYQMALRNAMHDYVREFIKDGNITAFIEHGIGVMGGDAGGSVHSVQRGGVKAGTNINHNR